MWSGFPYSSAEYAEWYSSRGYSYDTYGVTDLSKHNLHEDPMGMTLTAGSVTLDKNESNLIGISIGGGGKYCPCLYVVQVFDNTAASREGTLQSGDEITGVNNINVKGKSKTEVAQLIQRSQGSVTIHYNKLHPDLKQGKSLDIVLKKVKHRLVESMSSSTADALGLSRAILCNDSLVKKLDDLSKAEEMYRALIDHAKLVFKSFFDLIQVYKKFGDVFCSIGVREIQQSANEAFNQFGEAHRSMEKYGIQMLKKLKPILGDLGTYLHKAIPDTRLTIKRYADTKFEYLSYCLKVKEMDDEEVQFAQMQEPLYRVETGNYEYRLILRCRQDARTAFARLRSDVLVKLELLDSKHVQHLTTQLTRLVSILAQYHTECEQLMHGKHWFPIELDLVGTALYDTTSSTCGGDRRAVQEYHDEDDGGGDEDEEYGGDDIDDDILIDAVEATEETCKAAAATGNNTEEKSSNELDLLCQLSDLNLASPPSESDGPKTDGAGERGKSDVHSMLGELSEGSYQTALANMMGIPPSLMSDWQQVMGPVMQQPPLPLLQQTTPQLQMMPSLPTQPSMYPQQQFIEHCNNQLFSPTNPAVPISASLGTTEATNFVAANAAAKVPPSSGGLSFLSQELMADSSMEKQLSVFRSPVASVSSEGGGPDSELLLAGDQEKSGSFPTSGGAQNMNSDNTKPNKEDNLEDVNLLDAF